MLVWRLCRAHLNLVQIGHFCLIFRIKKICNYTIILDSYQFNYLIWPRDDTFTVSTHRWMSFSWVREYLYLLRVAKCIYYFIYVLKYNSMLWSLCTLMAIALKSSGSMCFQHKLEVNTIKIWNNFCHSKMKQTFNLNLNLIPSHLIWFCVDITSNYRQICILINQWTWLY